MAQKPSFLVSILKKFEEVEIGTPVLIGHIFLKLRQSMAMMKISKWATEKNVANGFPVVTFSFVSNAAKKLKNYRTFFVKQKVEEFLNLCEKPVHEIFKSKSTSSSSTATTTTSAPKYRDASTNTETITISDASTQTQKSLKKLQREEKKLISNICSRKLFYLCKLHNIASKNIPPLMESVFEFFNIEGKIFGKTAVSMMAAELGFIADFITVEKMFNSADATLIFDATTKEDGHINNVMIATPESSSVVSIQVLPGGTAQDYALHIVESIDRLAQVHSTVSCEPLTDTKNKILSKITACLTDRASVNHATLYLLELKWNKKLIELNCNIHPLEAITRSVCSHLEQFEDTSVKELVLSSKGCIAQEIVIKMSSLRYSFNKGLIKEFKDFLGSKFSTKVVPRYRGNRINIIFHLAFVYFVNREDFSSFLKTYKESHPLCRDLDAAYGNEIADLQLKVLGIIGKLFSGPWMSTFYTPLKKQYKVTDGIMIVKELLDKLQIVVKNPIKLLDSTLDLFGNPINLDEDTVKLMSRPSQRCDLFTSMMKAALEAIIDVLQRQYLASFERIDGLREAAITSARLHTMEAESVFGEYSGRKQSSASLDPFTISNLIKAKRNNVSDFIQNNEKLCDKLISLAIPQSRSDHNKNTKYKKMVANEIKQRISNKKKNLKDKAMRNLKLEFKNLEKTHPSLPNEILSDKFPDYGEMIRDILLGSIIGRNISHIWNVDDVDRKFKGTIIDFRNPLYTIIYFGENFEEEEESEINKYELAADYVNDDLSFI